MSAWAADDFGVIKARLDEIRKQGVATGRQCQSGIDWCRGPDHPDTSLQCTGCIGLSKVADDGYYD